MGDGIAIQSTNNSNKSNKDKKKKKKNKNRGGSKKKMTHEQVLAFKFVTEWVSLDNPSSFATSSLVDDFGVQKPVGKNGDRVVFDLHCHSKCSDGFLSPSKVVERAHMNGVKVLALTDHDTMAGIPEAVESARKYGIKIIPGVEVSTIFYPSGGDTEAEEPVHVLAYYSSIGPSKFEELDKFLSNIRDGRYLRAKNMVLKLNKLKMALKWEHVCRIAALIGQRFSQRIKNRVAADTILQNQLRPFAQTQTPQSESLLKALFHNNQTKFPMYWDELLGTAAGSGVPLLDILLINFKKEILAFVPKEKSLEDDSSNECSTVLVVGESMAIAAHNEDANVVLVGHTYLIKGILPNGLFFVAYTYAGELPSSAFAFNSNGLAFTLNSVPPAEDEIVAGGIGRNFISRGILEATGIDDAINRIRSSEISVGHSYNLIEISTRRIVNVETASKKRISIHEVGEEPFFHANMYRHLHINQAQDESSISRQKRANVLTKTTKEDFLSILGDADDEKNPIYMTGPLLHTLCTAVIDLEEKTLSIIEGNPKKEDVSIVFSFSPKKLINGHHHNHL